MTIQDQLQQIEMAGGFKYPLSFVSMFEEFSTLLRTDGFRIRFSGARLLFSASEIATARESIPTGLLPFMREEHPPWPDIYAFDLGGDGPEFRVVVWSDHAIAMDWDSFPDFFQWARSFCQT